MVTTVINSIIETVAQKEGLLTYQVTKCESNQKGEGYLAKIYFVTVHSPIKTLDLVIKLAFTDQQIRQAVPVRNVFINEINFYTTIYPIFKNLLNEKKISIEFIPKCLWSSISSENEVLVLENLKSQQFSNIDKKLVLEDRHIRIALKLYARFHACSFALRNQKPVQFQKISQIPINIYTDFIELSSFLNNSISICKTVESFLIPGQDDEILLKFQKYTNNYKLLFLDSLKCNEQYSVLLHGDCWSNNILFKQNQDSLTDIRFLDFQLIKMGSVACDLSYFLYSGASKEIFDKLDDYLEVYYECFSTFLESLGSSPQLYTFSQLKNEWRQFSKFGLMMALILIKMKLTNQEDILDLTDGIAEKDNLKLAESQYDMITYKKRIRDLLLHMNDIDAL